MIFWLVTPGHLVCGESYFDFICTVWRRTRYLKRVFFRHTTMNEFSKKDWSPHSDLRGHISLVPTYIDWSFWLRQFWVVNIELVELIWIEFESRHFAKLSIYSRYMMKGLNYTEILYNERLIKPIDLLNIWVVMMAC